MYVPFRGWTWHWEPLGRVSTYTHVGDGRLATFISLLDLSPGIPEGKMQMGGRLPPKYMLTLFAIAPFRRAGFTKLNKIQAQSMSDISPYLSVKPCFPRVDWGTWDTPISLRRKGKGNESQAPGFIHCALCVLLLCSLFFNSFLSLLRTPKG